jgi:hypothetical protein
VPVGYPSLGSGPTRWPWHGHRRKARLDDRTKREHVALAQLMAGATYGRNPLGRICTGDSRGTDFFDERTDQSEVKARIIQKYFYAWTKVIGPSAKTMGGKIAYIDLYAGPGRYKDGAASTPLLVLEHAIGNSNLRDMLVTLFNDADQNHTATLPGRAARSEG